MHVLVVWNVVVILDFPNIYSGGIKEYLLNICFLFIDGNK
jgi:hypothetical protein